VAVLTNELPEDGEVWLKHVVQFNLNAILNYGRTVNKAALKMKIRV
jgi:hypothetical protein